MEHEWEIRFNLQPNTMLYAIQADKKHYKTDGEKNIKLNNIDLEGFKPWPKFEIEAMKAYTELILAYQPEARSDSNSSELSNNDNEPQTQLVFMAKRISETQEIYIHNNTNPDLIDEFLKDIWNSVEIDDDENSCQTNSTAINDESKRLSPRKRNCNKQFMINQTTIGQLNKNLLNCLWLSSLQANLIISKQWFLLPDGSMVSNLQCERRTDTELKDPEMPAQGSVTASEKEKNYIQAGDKYHRLYLSDKCNAYTNESQIQENIQTTIFLKAEFKFSITLCKILTDKDYEEPTNYDEYDKIIDLLENSKLENLWDLSPTWFEDNISFVYNKFNSEKLLFDFKVTNKRLLTHEEIKLETYQNSDKFPKINFQNFESVEENQETSLNKSKDEEIVIKETSHKIIEKEANQIADNNENASPNDANMEDSIKNDKENIKSSQQKIQIDISKVSSQNDDAVDDLMDTTDTDKPLDSKEDNKVLNENKEISTPMEGFQNDEKSNEEFYKEYYSYIKDLQIEEDQKEESTEKILHKIRMTSHLESSYNQNHLNNRPWTYLQDLKQKPIPTIPMSLIKSILKNNRNEELFIHDNIEWNADKKFLRDPVINK